MEIRKGVIIIFSLCILAIICITVVNHYQYPTTDRKNAHYVRALKDTNKNSRVIAKVDNESIMENDLKIKKIFNDNNLSDDKILDGLIEHKVLLHDAEKQNIMPSDAEVQNEVNEVRKKVQYDSDALKKIKDYQKRLGISQDTYWNEIVFDAYKENMGIDKLIKKEDRIKNNTSYERTMNDLYNKAKQDHRIKIMKKI